MSPLFACVSLAYRRNIKVPYPLVQEMVSPSFLFSLDIAGFSLATSLTALPGLDQEAEQGHSARLISDVGDARRVMAATADQ